MADYESGEGGGLEPGGGGWVIENLQQQYVFCSIWFSHHLFALDAPF